MFERRACSSFLAASISDAAAAKKKKKKKKKKTHVKQTKLHQQRAILLSIVTVALINGVFSS
jgi:hypothetical protein